MTPRFLTLPDVAETLNVTVQQARTLVQSGELLGIQVGGRGVWRVEVSELEAYIQRQYAQTRAKLQARADGRDPFGDDDADEAAHARSDHADQ